MSLSQHRTALMGLAMLMVIASHYGGWVMRYPGTDALGCWGVDLFLFLSAYGLAKGLHKHCEQSGTAPNWRRYWVKRWRRVWPLFALFSLLTTIVMAAPHFEYFNMLKDWVLRATTIAWWMPHSITPTDWYLSQLPLFYLLVPLLWPYMKQHAWWTLFLTLVSVMLIMWSYTYLTRNEMHGAYTYALARAPSFVLGLCLAFRKPRWPLFLSSALIAALMAPVLYKCAIIPYLQIYTFAMPLLLFILRWCLARMPWRVYRFLPSSDDTPCHFIVLIYSLYISSTDYQMPPSAHAH